MPVSFPAPSSLVGREEYITRFRARLEHFPFFLYGGIAGIGKTSLVLRLAKETRALGVKGAIYLPLWPGEAIASILARVEAIIGADRGGTQDRQGDPYTRMEDALEANKVCLVLDDVHNIRREDLLALLRSAKNHRGKVRIIAAGRGEPELPAIDRAAVHMERVGPLLPGEVSTVAAAAGVRGEANQTLVTDATRGGCSGHALTLRYLLGMFGSQLPPADFFESQTSRSVNAFRALIQLAGDRIDAKELDTLSGLASVNMPVSKPVAVRAFGGTVNRLIQQGMLDLIDGHVYAHALVGQVMVPESYKIGESAAKTVAKHLCDRGNSQNEPLLVLRAAELLAKVGSTSQALDVLTDVWLTARDFGFLEAYLKSVAAFPHKPSLDRRLKLLSARARMRQGNPVGVRAELESLAKEKDPWTRSRALAALTYVYSQLREHKKVVQAYEAVKKSNVSADLLVPAATLAAVSMVRIGKIADAEKLARSILTKIKNNRQFLDRQGEIYRLLARVYARSGRLAEAVTEAQAAAKAFESAGDLYHAATAWGFIGDLYRETGDFELARSSFVKFRDLAEKWGDRDLLQVAELAEAWVSLDVGDLTHAAKQIAAVEKDMSAAPSRRLRRYLAAAKALLEAGRGHHEQASTMLIPVIETWEQVGQRNIADILRAQRVRSLIACNDLGRAHELVEEALERLDPKVEAPRVASFLRESALIRLRRKDAKKAMAELSQARKLFAAGGNRREEALTLYRIAHAAIDEGDVALATERVKEALALAKKIKHTRVIAQCRELQGRIALIHGDAKTAVSASKEALQSLRKLGDELGTLHVSESLLRSLIAAGDLAGAIRLGPRVSDQADKLEIREVRVRAIVLTGVALLRRSRLEQASRCFRDIPEQKLSPLTTALMYRFGEGLASVKGDVAEMLARRQEWVTALKRLPEPQQEICRHLLARLDLPPSDRCLLRTRGNPDRLVSTEELAWMELAGAVDLYVDVENRWIEDAGERVEITAPELAKLFNRLVIEAPEPLDNAAVYEAAYSQPPPPKLDKKLKAPLRVLDKELKGTKHITIVPLKTGVKLVLPKTYAFILPRGIQFPDLKPVQRKILRLLRRFGTMPIQTVQDRCGLNRSSARRELGELVNLDLVETVRDGRGQAFRLA